MENKNETQGILYTFKVTEKIFTGDHIMSFSLYTRKAKNFILHSFYWDGFFYESMNFFVSYCKE